MTLPARPITVMQLPATLDGKQAQAFLRSLEDCAQTPRPSIVLDCSQLRRMDKPVLLLLLACLETAMKRNGDVRLAAIPTGVAPILESTGVSRLFKTFGTTADAIDSFRRPAIDIAPQSSRESNQAPADAA